MFYVLIYGLFAFSSLSVLASLNSPISDLLVLLMAVVTFFILYKRYIKDFGGIEKAKNYHRRLLNLTDIEHIDPPVIVEDANLEYEAAKARLAAIAFADTESYTAPNDGSKVIIGDSRFTVSKKRWGFLLFVFFIADIFTPYLSNWAFYIFSIMNFTAIFVALAPLAIESYHGFKQTGYKKTFKWISIGVAAIFALNLLNDFFFQVIDFEVIESGNQAIIQMMLKDNFLRVAFEVTFTAAIFEEFVFRGIFFRNLYNKNKVLAYVVTFFAFGIPHLLVGFIEGAGYSEFLFLPIYGMMGVLFAYIYVKTNSIYTAMGAHFFNNLISVVLILFI
ncbi:MAG: CPBP family intramembrane metalloprotease [Erysipelothrix sp.]|nr:CPBP family intramembrane metalloprotease [Erysipelothrix sp.]